MKLIADLKSVNRINEYQVDGFILSSSEFSTYNDRTFSLEEIKTVSKFCQDNNKLLIINIDKIMEEEDVPLVKEYIDQLIDIADYFIYGDFSVLTYFKNKNLTHKLIYDPKTMITNYYEALIHKRLNSLVAINNELTLEEIKDVIKADNCVMEVYGFHQMFYSKRAILSNYAIFQGEGRKFNDEKLIIKEETRDFEYPIYESKHGTFVYTPKIYCCFKELTELNSLQMIRVNGSFISEDSVIQVVNLYHELLLDFTQKDTLYEKLKTIDDRIDSGFLYKKSILVKEGAN